MAEHNRICVLASPAVAADSIARALAISGWSIGRVVSSISELQGIEHDLQSGDIVIAVDGGLPAGAIADELRRRVAGLRTVVVSSEPSETGPNAVRIHPSAEIRDLLRTLEGFETAPITESSLTSRHLEILQLIAMGMSTDEVGLKLGIASKTVNNHLSTVYRRLRARNLTQAVLRAVRAGLIDIVPQ